MTTQRSTGEWSLAVRQQAAVARVGQLGLRGLEMAVLLDEALLALAETLDVADVGLFELAVDWRRLTGRAGVHRGRRIETQQMAAMQVPAGRESMLGYTVLQGVVVVAPDLLNDSRFVARAAEFGVAAKAAITAPVGWGERPWGVVGAYSGVARSWTDDDIHFVQSMANTIGLAISRQRVEHDLRDISTRLDLSLAAGGLGAWTWDIQGDHVELSGPAMAIYGLEPETFDGAGDSLLAAVHPDDKGGLRGEAYEGMQTTGEHHNIFRVVLPSGEVRWAESWGRLLEEAGQPFRMVGVVADITERREREAVKEQLLAAEQHARHEAELAREHLLLLAEASALFSASLNPEVILASLPEFCVPRLCDLCVVDVFDDRGQLVEAASAARNSAVLPDVRLLRERRAALGELGGMWSKQQVAGRARSKFQPRLTDQHYQQVAADQEHLEIFRRVQIRSSMVVPLIARDRVIGVVTLINLDDTREPGLDLLAMVEDLAGRAALAIDNGRLFESRNRVARSLQAALLPPALPVIAELGLAAKYRVAEGDIEIGGDFYDVIEVGKRSWGIVVGDVCGRGPDAAALTGLMRHSVRTAVVRESVPSRVLAQTNDAVLDQIDDARFCTAAYLRLDLDQPGPGQVRVTASSAGHPRPVVLRADGRAEVMECSGLLLGIIASPPLVDAELVLGPGDSVVLYTDGVTEARRGREFFGEKRLLETVQALANLDAEGIAAGLDDAVRRYQDDANDDVAILVAKVMR